MICDPTPTVTPTPTYASLDSVPDLLAQLTKEERTQLLEDINYLNLQELHSFCRPHGIPYKILAQYPNGTVKLTQDTDRKPILLDRVRRFLATGEPGQPTRIPTAIVREDDPPARLQPDNRIYYRWYSKRHLSVLRTLSELTAGRFVDGAVARVLIMDYWTRGKAPTLAEFAQGWTKAKAEEHLLLTPEYAYLTDLKQKQVGTDWKSLRTARARSGDCHAAKNLSASLAGSALG